MQCVCNSKRISPETFHLGVADLTIHASVFAQPEWQIAIAQTNVRRINIWNTGLIDLIAVPRTLRRIEGFTLPSGSNKKITFPSVTEIHYVIGEDVREPASVHIFRIAQTFPCLVQTSFCVYKPDQTIGDFVRNIRTHFPSAVIEEINSGDVSSEGD